MNRPDVKICTRCVLPGTFPGISFDEGGVCSRCRSRGAVERNLPEERSKCRRKFLSLVEQLAARKGKPGGHSYDALMAYSGGKDSTYTLALLSRQYGLRVLALSFDNGFVSPAAVANIRKVTDSLGVDHLFFKPRWEVMRKLFATGAVGELYPRKALERASTICTICMGLVKSVCLRTALEAGIPLVAYGWSPGQAPLQSSIMKNNPSMVRASQEAQLGPLREAVGREADCYFLEERHYEAPERFPYNVHPLAWEAYDEDLIVDRIGQYGWTAPDDTDSNSTNCLLNGFANSVHQERYGYHPYALEIAGLVREGHMTRAAGLAKLSQPPDERVLGLVKARLGL